MQNVWCNVHEICARSLLLAGPGRLFYSNGYKNQGIFAYSSLNVVDEFVCRFYFLLLIIRFGKGLVIILDLLRKDPTELASIVQMLQKVWKKFIRSTRVNGIRSCYFPSPKTARGRDPQIIYVHTTFASGFTRRPLRRVDPQKNLKSCGCGKTSYQLIAYEQFKRNWQDSLLSMSYPQKGNIIRISLSMLVDRY
ncbi:uncharacterized protein LOC123429036 [Hordeum vulgare subsp. vulgare]|uniref:uncharacterized protein LOC123429036 n=1 Tax=Hordeum vulgare subsp. vulgare TaxID=112509 RepID=UPI001D1A51C4|nr:uncharacterized protein LOC123429036 [Hordeum vulgare subsp. vulgare]